MLDAVTLTGTDGRQVGAADLTSTFRIGAAQVVEADVDSFRMIVLPGTAIRWR